MNKKLKSNTIIGITCVCLTVMAHASSPHEDCLTDLEHIPAFLLQNDTGAPAHLEQKGQAELTQASHPLDVSSHLVADPPQLHA